MTDILDELQWRGLLAQHTDLEALREHLNAGPVTFYCGYDPTAPSLHHGHLVQLIVMRHLQLAGHRPLALVGGATGQIGDPRQSGERQLQSTEVVKGWADRLHSQISKFLDFEGPAAATMVNNLDWTQEMSAIDLLRTIGKYFRVGTMLNKDIVARRIASDEGISYTEFSYQVLQANDFLELYRRNGCTLETGGNDQWGNMVGGVDLIRKVEGVDTHVMTTPIITKADGTKFGKSEGGAIWLDPEMMTPYAFYQFWLQVADDDVVRFLKIFTFKSREEIEALAVEVAERPHQRAAQKALAASVTELVHGADQLQRVLAATDALWVAATSVISTRQRWPLRPQTCRAHLSPSGSRPWRTLSSLSGLRRARPPRGALSHPVAPPSTTSRSRIPRLFCAKKTFSPVDWLSFVRAARTLLFSS